MSNVYQNPVCMITGGSSGIGLATARKFFDAGYRISICGRSQERLDEASKLIGNDPLADSKRLLTVVADLAEPAQAKAFAQESLEHFGRIDVLVNNAGVAPLSPFGAITEDSFENLINVNVRSSFYLTQLAWTTMVKQRGGTIVNISSLSAVDPFVGFSTYGASKAWLDLLTHSLAQEGKNLNIRACSVRPGAVETPLLRGLFPDFPADQCVSPQAVAEVVWGCVESPNDYPSGSAFPITADPAPE